MKYTLTLLISLGIMSVGRGADFAITSLSSNGELTWTNSTTNATYRVEWASSIAGPWHQFNSLTNLDSIKATNTAVTVAVPMFYRVVWTDPPAPQPIGDWEFKGFWSDGTLIATGLVSMASATSGTWAFTALPSVTNTWLGGLQCGGGDVVGSPEGGFQFSMFMEGCEFTEGAFFLSGTLLGNTYSGAWYEEGAVAPRIGDFVARRRTN